MKIYEYKNGSKIERELSPDVVYALGEYHVGDCKIYNATTSGGNTGQFDSWNEASEFLDKGEEW